MEASKLKEILEQHKLWLETNGVQGERANLSYADLINANLWGANLSYADLINANLRGANLGGAILQGADLNCANLSYADLINANLWGANLINADLINADLYGTNLYGTNLGGADLWDANLYRANLGGSNLTGADLCRADLCRADLTNAILPDISWIIPGCLVQLNKIRHHFYLEKENKMRNLNFAQDSFGFVIQDNPIEKTFDMLVEDSIIRNIPDWVKYSGLKQIELA